MDDRTSEGPAVLETCEQDAIAADETIDMCLGPDVAPRKRWIQTHASEVQNLDTVG